MSSSLKWKLVIGVLIVFIAGIATGVFASAWRFHHRIGGARAGAIGERMQHHLEVQLGLTPEQSAKIRPIIDQTASRLDAVRTDTSRSVTEIMEQSRRDLAPDLSPDQLVRLDQMRERHRRRMLQHGRLNPPPDHSR